MSQLHTSSTLGAQPGNAVLPLGDEADGRTRSVPATTPASRAESLQRSGNRLVVSGFVITVVGVVAYCAACFAGGMDAELGDLMFQNAVPFAQATLAILGLGTVVWLVGSITYLRGAMEAAEEPDGEPGSQPDTRHDA